ncbi:hypothetical protein R0G64_04865 [Pseudomonas otitidis]|uniref:Uncharacterized protein n=1 Tax=Metapseudomonas otitidis TaxID=319939 RepID=A0ABU3XL95_9GAMM|nr:hypothetical protein [Pseudomonas otitidis]MDV3438719.1 hypothetical protein [Pseudomonas otitidis]MDV3438764.1 hypothetical protein [Pseudomonas otitidis]
MASDFDRLMCLGDRRYFAVFGERGGEQQQPRYTAPGPQAVPVEVQVAVQNNAQVAGADGLFQVIQHLAEIRLKPGLQLRRDGLLELPSGRYRLERLVDADGLVERWSLMSRG